MTSLVNDLTLFGDLINPLCCSNNPDCLNCMRTKLRATCIVIFVQHGDEWDVGSYQGEIPVDAAEADFYGMLKENVPQTLMKNPEGLLTRTEQEVLHVFPTVASFSGKSLIAARFKLGKYEGIRLAWRDQTDPFSHQELMTIQCQGRCPDGCGPF